MHILWVGHHLKPWPYTLYMNHSKSIVRKVWILILLIVISRISIAQIATVPPGKDALLFEKGLTLLNKEEPDSAKILFAQLATDEVRDRNPQLFIRAQVNIGRIYGDKGDNVAALQHYQEALQEAENLNDKRLIAPILKNIGVLYISWKKFDKALEYYDKTEVIARELNDQELIADCQNNKGTVYEQTEEYDKAIGVYKSALHVYTEKNITGKIAMALSNLAIVYKFKKNYAESLQYNFKAIALAEQTGNKWNMAATYNNIGNLYGAMGNYREAITYCEKALAIAKEIDAQEIVESIYDSMADAAATAGDYKKAFEYHKLFSESLNEFVNTEYTRQLSELNIRFETEKKQTVILQQQFEISKRNYWLLTASIVFIFLLMAAYFIWRNHRHALGRRLQEEILRQKEIEARALFEGEQTERIRLARDLHDGVGQMLSLIKMNISALPAEDTTVLKTIGLVDKTIDEVRNVSHNLIPEELNFGIFPALEDLAEKVNSSGVPKMEIEISSEIRSKAFKKQHELSIYRIVQEIVNNIVKHASASTIRLSIHQHYHGTLLLIQDNGHGINMNTIHASTGIGWKNINARVHLMNGKIEIRSGKQSGTQIEITLP